MKLHPTDWFAPFRLELMQVSVFRCQEVPETRNLTPETICSFSLD